MRRARALLFLATTVAVACASAPVSVARLRPWPGDSAHIVMLERDQQGLSLSVTAMRQIASMMGRAIREQVEPAACVLDYKVWTEPDSSRLVDVYTLTLAESDSADMLNAWAHRSMCQDTLPGIHGHVYRGKTVWWPSDVDLLSAQYNRAPFNLLFYRMGNDTTIGVTLYWRQP